MKLEFKIGDYFGVSFNKKALNALIRLKLVIIYALFLKMQTRF